MKTSKSILVGAIMLFTVITAVLILLTIFNFAGSDETQRAIVKLAEACGVVAVAGIVLFGLSSFGKRP